MSLWHCRNCTTAYSVGAEKCPHCASTDYQTLPVRRAYVCEGCETAYRLPLSACPRCRGTSFKETSMAKITKAAGATNADLGEVAAEEPAVETPVHEPETEPAEDAAEQDVDLGEQTDAESDEDAGESEDDEQALRDYSSLTVVELREALDLRGLSTSGVKAELIQRLTDDDAKE